MVGIVVASLSRGDLQTSHFVGSVKVEDKVGIGLGDRVAALPFVDVWRHDTGCGKGFQHMKDDQRFCERFDGVMCELLAIANSVPKSGDGFVGVPRCFEGCFVSDQFSCGDGSIGGGEVGKEFTWGDVRIPEHGVTKDAVERLVDCLEQQFHQAVLDFDVGSKFLTLALVCGVGGMDLSICCVVIVGGRGAWVDPGNECETVGNCCVLFGGYDQDEVAMASASAVGWDGACVGNEFLLEA